jgi:hypothetical protein
MLVQRTNKTPCRYLCALDQRIQTWTQIISCATATEVRLIKKISTYKKNKSQRRMIKWSWQVNTTLRPLIEEQIPQIAYGSSILYYYYYIKPGAISSTYKNNEISSQYTRRYLTIDTDTLFNSAYLQLRNERMGSHHGPRPTMRIKTIQVRLHQQPLASGGWKNQFLFGGMCALFRFGDDQNERCVPPATAD